MIKSLLFIVGLLLLAVVVCQPVSADVVVGTRAVTLNGPSGMLVPLGIENVVPLANARVWYNWICIIIILPLAAVASKRNYEMYAGFLPVVAGILAIFGWLHTADMTKTWGIIIFCGFIAAGLYMKKVLRETWGLGGQGSTFMTITVFMIVLSMVVGMVNAGAIWQDNTGVQPNEYLNVDLQKEVTQVNNPGGIGDDIVNSAMALINAGLAAVKVLLAVVFSIGCFSGALLLIFPFLTGSPLVLAALGIFQVMIWILDIKFINDVFYAKSIYATEL